MASVKSYNLKQNKHTNALYSSAELQKETGLFREIGLITKSDDIMFYIGEDIRWINLKDKALLDIGCISVRIIGDE